MVRLGSLQWQECISSSRKWFFLSSEVEKNTQPKHHTHTHTHCCNQWRWWKTSKRKMTHTEYSLNGYPGTNPLKWLVAFCFERIKLSYCRNQKQHKWSHKYGQNDGSYSEIMTTDSSKSLQTRDLISNYTSLTWVNDCVGADVNWHQ